MTREEANTLLEQVLMELAKSAVRNKRLLEYADELEYYLQYLDKEKEKEGKDTQQDDNKAE